MRRIEDEDLVVGGLQAFRHGRKASALAHPYTWGVVGSENDGVRLDRDGDVWVGRFPGLGSVRVFPDGRIDVDVERDADFDNGSVAAQRNEDEIRQALHFGWGDPLSLVRRHFVLAEGVAVVPPESDRCILVHGDVHDTAIVMLGLAMRGWRVLADRVVPLEFGESSVVAHPRSAPFIAARRRAETAGFVSHAVRRETNTVAVDIERSERPCVLSMLVSVRVRRPNQVVLEILSGHERFESARKVLLGGVLSPIASSPEDSMKRSLQLSSLANIELRVDSQSPEADIDAFVTWWESL